MAEIRYRSKPIEQTIDIRKALGEKDIARNGKRIGEILSIHIDPVAMTIEGIKVKKGLFSKDYIGRNYIRYIGEDGAILKTTPVTEYLGMPVFNSLGKKIGSVEQVIRTKKTNTMEAIIVDRGAFLRSLRIPKKNIAKITDKIILNKRIK